MTTRVSLLLLISLGALACMVIAAVLLRSLHDEERYLGRVLRARRASEIDPAEDVTARAGRPLLRLIGALGELITKSGLLSAKTKDSLEQTLRIAGFRDRDALGILIGGKLVIMLLGPITVWLLLHEMGWQPPLARLWPYGGAIIGLLAPDYIVSWLRRRHIKAVQQGLPDALDLMVICSEAGLALEPALERVGIELGRVHPAVAEEFIHTCQNLRISGDRRIALLDMGTRTGVENLRRLGATLVQTMQYGTPLTQSLRIISGDMRQEAMTAFETRAGRLAVLITLPMIIFILPCVFMVMAGPAMVQVIDTMSRP